MITVCTCVGRPLSDLPCMWPIHLTAYLSAQYAAARALDAANLLTGELEEA